MLFLSMRGVVPVLSRPSSNPSARRLSESFSAANSPALPAGKLRLADVDQALEERAGGDDHALRADTPSRSACARPITCLPFLVPTTNLLHHRLLDLQPRLAHQRPAHEGLVEPLVHLRAERLDSGAFAGVEHADVGVGGVGRERLLTAERVDLAHEVTLRRPADAAVAGHVGDGVDIDRQKKRIEAHPRGRKRGLAARMPRPDDYDIVGSHNSYIIARRSGRASAP